MRVPTSVPVLDPRTVEEFLASPPIAVVGASDDRTKFGGTVYRALREHGLAVVPVNPHGGTVAGDACYPDLGSVPDPVGGVLVVVPGGAAVDAVRQAAARGVRRVWLFRGLGAPGAVTPAAVAAAEEAGMALVAGACPLMFLEPVGAVHRLHRGLRRLNGSLARSG